MTDFCFLVLLEVVYHCWVLIWAEQLSLLSLLCQPSSDSSEQEGSQRVSAQDAVEPETDVGAFCPISRLEALHLDRPEALCLRNAEKSPPETSPGPLQWELRREIWASLLSWGFPVRALTLANAVLGSVLALLGVVRSTVRALQLSVVKLQSQEESQEILGISEAAGAVRSCLSGDLLSVQGSRLWARQGTYMWAQSYQRSQCDGSWTSEPRPHAKNPLSSSLLYMGILSGSYSNCLHWDPQTKLSVPILDRAMLAPSNQTWQGRVGYLFTA